MSKTNHTIIIKRPKKVSKGHHGGNWKVAYADFMTALMAFFLLLWILSVSDEEKLEGLAKHFSPATISLNDAAGHDGILDLTGSEVTEEQKDAPPASAEASGASPDEADQPIKASAPLPDAETNPWAALIRETLDRPDAQATLPDQLDSAEDQLTDAFTDGDTLEHLAENVIVTRTETGMIIEIVDLGDRPMFRLGSADLTDDIRSILREVVPAIADMPLRISITGHTDATPFSGSPNYGNWELSADRANATRRELTALGLREMQFVSVTGAAAVAPLVPEDPTNARNRRVTINLEAAES